MRKQTWIPNPIRREVSLSSNGQCYQCKIKADSAKLDRWKIPKFYIKKIPFEIDHIIPLSKGGKTTIKNLALSCRSCNRKRSRLDTTVNATKMVNKINRSGSH